MPLRDFNVLKNIWIALKQFFNEDGLDKSSVLAYYSIFSSFFLLTFFIFLFTSFLGDPDVAVTNLYPFTEDFFAKISPDIYQKAGELSTRLKEIGIIGVGFAAVLGFLVIKKIVQYVNEMYKVDLKTKKEEKGFMVRRVSEFSLLLLIGFLMAGSFLFTGVISAGKALITQNDFLASHINPDFVEFVNTFLLRYALPFTITFTFFFILYKWIPEKKIYVKGAFISAVISTVLWETIKRLYAYYLVNISIMGKIEGPIIAVILFGFWMEVSMGIMLFGAKLSYIFHTEHLERLQLEQEKLNWEKNDQFKTAQPAS